MTPTVTDTEKEKTEQVSENLLNHNDPEHAEGTSHGKEDTTKCAAVFGMKIVHLFFPNLVFTKLLLSSVIHATHSLFPLFYTGQITDKTALAVVSQFTFVQVVLKVVYEGVVGSLFHVVGRDYLDRRMEALQALKMATSVVVIAGLALSSVVIVFTDQVISIINTPEQIRDATRRFLYLSAFSYPIAMVNEIIKNYVLITTHGLLVAASLADALCTAMLNAFLFGQQQASAHWGVQHLGIYKVLESVLRLVLYLFFFFLIEKMTPLTFLWRVPFLSNWRSKLKSLYDVSWGNFCESLVRNFFYFAVTLQFVNHLGSNVTAAWHVVNTIVWSLLLIPTFAIANHVNIAVGLRAAQLNLKKAVQVIAWETSGALCAWLVVIAVSSTICWSNLATLFSPHNTEVQKISQTMFYQIGWVFVLYSFSTAMTGLLYGTGKTHYIFYQSIITNVLVYLVPWICYLAGILIPTYYVVIILYIVAMIIALLVTSIFCVKVWNTLESTTVCNI